MQYFLAVDIGASSGRHILGWLEDGMLKTEEIYRFKNGATDRGGKLTWNADALYASVLAGLKRAGELGKIPAYIGIDTWAVDYALLDENDGRIGEVFCYRDGRTKSAVVNVHNTVSFEELYERTGIQFQPFNTVYQLYADKTDGKLSDAKSFLMLPDYLHFLLTGEKKQEYTNATSTGLVNAQTHDWDRELIEKLGLPQQLFKKLAQPGTVVGAFRKEVADEVGYSANVMLPATHDTASAVLAAPIEDEAPYISSGTWSLLGVEQKAAHTDGYSRQVNYSNEGSINFTFRYQKNIMGLWMLQSVKRELKDVYSFPELANLAKRRKRTDIVDVNDDRFLAPASMIEEIQRAVGRKLSTGSLVRIIYDSLAGSYRKAIGELERNTGKTFSTLSIIGGGSRDEFLNKLTAEATGKRVIVGPVEATAIGNLIMQMVGAGVLENIREARLLIKKSFEIKEIS